MSNDLDSWLAEFHKLNPVEIEEDTKPSKEEYKLDLFKTVLPALDRRDVNFYNKLTPEQQKDIGIWVLTRWMSSTSNNVIDQIYTVNEVVNKNSKAITSKHKELQWMLLAISGSGKAERHVWPGVPKGVKKNLLEEAILSIYPLINDDELDLMLTLNSKEELTDFFKQNGYDDKSIKELFKSSTDK